MYIVYRLVGFIHSLAKRRSFQKLSYPRDITRDFNNENFSIIDIHKIINPILVERLELSKNDLLKIKYWIEMIDESKIKNTSNNQWPYLVAFSRKSNTWILSSWIWTSAITVKLFTQSNQLQKAILIGDEYLKRQLEDGSWIVRNDVVNSKFHPICAPNDSAYIANNAMISLYKKTLEEKYLNSAIKCAHWIMSNADSSGMVPFGFDLIENRWVNDVNIVDVGFTIPLFIELYKITGKIKYKSFAERFAIAYIKYFYDERKRMFYTSIDKYNNGFGGYFTRGQAWALEGLIPLYELNRDNNLYQVICAVIDNLMIAQTLSGAWPYNSSKKIYGLDNKGSTILVLSLLNWYKLYPNEKLNKSIIKGLKYSLKHTAIKGEFKGLVMDYSLEGGIIQDFYSSVGMVYTTIYGVLSLMKMGEYFHV